MTAGRLRGIARHDRPHGPIETMTRVAVTVAAGIEGDYRGWIKPGGKGRRQVTVMARADWDAAIADAGAPTLDWSVRRANLLVDDIALPHDIGVRIAFAGGVLLEITGETEPCSRMDAILPGLRAALTPGWRGGVTTRVLQGGTLAVGDEVRIERP